MPDNGKPKAHRYADLFPMMTALELEALAADIAEHGLRQPIVLYEGLVLDGRNRLLACEKAGIEPTFTDHQGDDVSARALVISLNVQRRDLTAAQRAIVAARVGIDDTQRLTRTARKSVAQEFKVGELQVKQAKALLSEAPDLAAQVEACALTLAKAYEECQARRKQAAQRSKLAERVAEYKDAVNSGEMTLEEALEKIQEQADEEKQKVIAQADARSQWLKQLVAFAKWVEQYVGQYGDDYLAWYTIPGSPGLFDHGITPERIDAMKEQLDRVKIHSLGGNHRGNSSSAGPGESAS